MKKFFYFWGPVVLLALIMFVLSSMSIDIKKDPFPLFDKLVHLSMYAFFAGLLFRALSSTFGNLSFIWLAILTVVLTIFYGLSDEFHQSFTPGRTPDIKDVVADGVGAMLAMTVLFIWKRVFQNFE